MNPVFVTYHPIQRHSMKFFRLYLQRGHYLSRKKWFGIIKKTPIPISGFRVGDSKSLLESLGKLDPDETNGSDSAIIDNNLFDDSLGDGTKTDDNSNSGDTEEHTDGFAGLEDLLRSMAESKIEDGSFNDDNNAASALSDIHWETEDEMFGNSGDDNNKRRKRDADPEDWNIDFGNDNSDGVLDGENPDDTTKALYPSKTPFSFIQNHKKSRCASNTSTDLSCCTNYWTY